MGRNAIPKLFEWRDGSFYRFRTQETGLDGLAADNGKLIVYERVTSDMTEVLATAWADGLCELMATMFADGFAKGKAEGINEAKSDIRRALGVKP